MSSDPAYETLGFRGRGVKILGRPDLVLRSGDGIVFCRVGWRDAASQRTIGASPDGGRAENGIGERACGGAGAPVGSSTILPHQGRMTVRPVNCTIRGCSPPPGEKKPPQERYLATRTGLRSLRCRSAVMRVPPPELVGGGELGLRRSFAGQSNPAGSSSHWDAKKPPQGRYLATRTGLEPVLPP